MSHSINFDDTFKDLDNQTITDRKLELDGTITETTATLGRVSANALLAMADSDRDMTGDVKVKRYDLAMKVVRGETVLKAEDIAIIKSAIGKHYAPLIVGQAWRMLDPAEIKTE